MALATLCFCRTGRAEEPRHATLHYEVASGITGCFELSELQDAVAARLGYVPFSEQAPLAIDARVNRAGSRLTAKLVVTDAQGAQTRELGSATRDCGELSRSLALAISVAIDPMSLVRPAAPGPKPEPAPSTAPAPPAASKPSESSTGSATPASATSGTAPPLAAAPAAPEPSPSPTKAAAAPSPEPPSNPRRSKELDSQLHVRGLLTGHAALFSLPGPAPGFSAGMGLRYRAVWLDAAFRYDLPGKKSGGGGEVKARFTGAELSVCHGNLRFGFCPTAVIGSLAGTGAGVTTARRDSSLMAALGLRLLAEVALSKGFFLHFHVDGLYRLTPTELQLNGSTVWKAGPFQLTPAAGVGGVL